MPVKRWRRKKCLVHRIITIEWCMLKGTFKDHLVQPPPAMGLMYNLEKDSEKFCRKATRS